ncbi:hypothetical protein DMUE_2639 [Dictyocoela muelleri]|nr:hypothetical protein DMUE_2639 [Dictyocoela muelleri]
MKLHNYEFHSGSLIELVIQPDMNILRIINEFKSNEPHIFIDTKGNLSYKNKTIEIFDIEEFKNTIVNIIIQYKDERKKYKDNDEKKKNNDEKFVLFIDSMTFFADNYNFSTIIEIYGLIWEVIYETNCTVVAINHYKMITKNNFVPRLGISWYRIISYRILYKWKNRNVIYEIYKLFDENIIK